MSPKVAFHLCEGLGNTTLSRRRASARARKQTCTFTYPNDICTCDLFWQRRAVTVVNKHENTTEIIHTAERNQWKLDKYICFLEKSLHDPCSLDVHVHMRWGFQEPLVPIWVLKLNMKCWFALSFVITHTNPLGSWGAAEWLGVLVMAPVKPVAMKRLRRTSGCCKSSCASGGTIADLSLKWKLIIVTHFVRFTVTNPALDFGNVLLLQPILEQSLLNYQIMSTNIK